jgi:hypothetical protein
MQIDVVLLLYKRPEHLSKVLEGIVQNNISFVKVYLDYSNDPSDLKKQSEILNIIKNFKKCHIELTKRPTKFGLAGNVRASLDETFKNGADAVLLLEDDCVLKPGGYQFFEQGLRNLKNNREIRSLCGYTFPACSFVLEPETDVLLLSRFSTWGWATWADRWKQYESDLSKLVKAIELAGISVSDFAPDIERLCQSEYYLSGKADIWSVNWILIHYLTSTFAAYPCECVIENIGLDGSGTNCEVTNIFQDNRRKPGKNDYNWKKLQFFLENEVMVRDFLSVNGLKTYPKP